MAGAPSGSLFTGGQTACPLPGLSGVPNSATIDSLGNLWVGIRENSFHFALQQSRNGVLQQTSVHARSLCKLRPLASDSTFTTGMRFVGHDLWASTLEIMFVIKNADSICLVGQNPACGSGNGTAVLALPTVIGATTMVSDQVYPATNGNNLYIGDANGVVWVGNVAAGAAGQTLASTYIDPATGLANVGAVVIDGTDPGEPGDLRGRRSKRRGDGWRRQDIPNHADVGCTRRSWCAAGYCGLHCQWTGECQLESGAGCTTGYQLHGTQQLCVQRIAAG